MVDKQEISRQLKRLGATFQFWCRAEIRELPKILFEGEQLQHVLIGHYEGGFALFCATDHRVLLIDKKPFYLTLEDIRYDMISDVQYNHRLVDATMRLGTVHKTISFTAYNHNKLRNFTGYIQEQVMFFRQQQSQVPAAQQLPIAPATTPIPASTAAQSPVETGLSVPVLPRTQVMNPYNMPIVIRRRVSRFY